ncbi:MAG: hypothetical protein AABX72_00420 [Nanoarchaeota archaeon]
MTETRAVQIKFLADSNLVGIIQEMLLSPSSRQILSECNPCIISGLPESVPEQALFHYLNANNVTITKTNYVYVSASQSDIVEHENGVNLPAKVLQNETEFGREVINRIIQYIGSPRNN